MKRLKVKVGDKYYLYGKYLVEVVKPYKVNDKLYHVKFLTDEGKKYYEGDTLIVYSTYFREEKSN